MECFVMLYGRNKISHESDYIFVRNGQRITARQIAYVLEKYAERQGVSTKWKNPHKYGLFHTLQRARDGTRTRDPDLGKVVLHQLSHSRISLVRLYFISYVSLGQVLLYYIGFTLSTKFLKFIKFNNLFKLF